MSSCIFLVLFFQIFLSYNLFFISAFVYLFLYLSYLYCVTSVSIRQPTISFKVWFFILFSLIFLYFPLFFLLFFLIFLTILYLNSPHFFPFFSISLPSFTLLLSISFFFSLLMLLFLLPRFLYFPKPTFSHLLLSFPSFSFYFFNFLGLLSSIFLYIIIYYFPYSLSPYSPFLHFFLFLPTAWLHFTPLSPISFFLFLNPGFPQALLPLISFFFSLIRYRFSGSFLSFSFFFLTSTNSPFLSFFLFSPILLLLLLLLLSVSFLYLPVFDFPLFYFSLLFSLFCNCPLYPFLAFLFSF